MPTLDATAKVIYLALFLKVRQGKFPTYAEIGEVACVSRRAIDYQIKALERVGLVQVHRAGLGKPNQYILKHLPDKQGVGTKKIRTPRQPFRKASIPRDIRWQVWFRDNFSCRNCASSIDLAVDHIIPESKGGLTELANLQTLCRSCNRAKGANEWTNS